MSGPIYATPGARIGCRYYDAEMVPNLAGEINNFTAGEK
jgi:hypothetical protein